MYAIGKMQCTHACGISVLRPSHIVLHILVPATLRCARSTSPSVRGESQPSDRPSVELTLESSFITPVPGFSSTSCPVEELRSWLNDVSGSCPICPRATSTIDDCGGVSGSSTATAAVSTVRVFPVTVSHKLENSFLCVLPN